MIGAIYLGLRLTRGPAPSADRPCLCEQQRGGGLGAAHKSRSCLDVTTGISVALVAHLPRARIARTRKLRSRGRSARIESELAGTPGSCKYRPAPSAAREGPPPTARSSHDSDVVSPASATAIQSGQRGSRAARPFWSGSGGRRGVSDLGGGEQPTADASAASTSGRPRPGVALRSQAPRCPMEQKRLKETPSASRPSVRLGSFRAA